MMICADGEACWMPWGLGAATERGQGVMVGRKSEKAKLNAMQRSGFSNNELSDKSLFKLSHFEFDIMARVSLQIQIAYGFPILISSAIGGRVSVLVILRMNNQLQNAEGCLWSAEVSKYRASNAKKNQNIE